MKTNLLKKLAYVALMVGVVLTSCSDDNPNGIDDIDNGNKPQYEKGYFTMSFTNSPLTRTEGDLEAGSGNESTLSTILIVLYDAVTNKVAYQFPLANPADIISTNTASSGENIYVTKAKEVERKPYKLALFLNYTSDISTATAVGKDVSELTTLRAATVSQLTGSGSSFLMSNFAGLVNVKESDIKQTSGDAEQNPVPLFVERAVAKVGLTVKLTTGLEMNDKVDKSSIFWQEDVINKSTYWMRKQTNMLVNDSDPTVDAQTPESAANSNTGVTPSDRIFMYAESPYFRNTSLAYYNYYSLTSTPAPDPSSEYTYLANNDLSVITRSPGAVTYVTENTMTAEEQWDDVTTSVVIKLVINPETTALNMNGNGSLAANSSYYVYRNRVFSGAELDIIADTSNPDFTVNSTQYKWPNFIAVAGNEDLIGLQGILNDTNTKTDLGITTNYATEPTASKKSSGLFFYKGGVNVYNVPIRHFSNALQSVNMKYGRYGVVRNNVYKLTLKSIKKYGDIEIPKKENPDDAESWVAVQFEILPWLVREQDIDL